MILPKENMEVIRNSAQSTMTGSVSHASTKLQQSLSIFDGIPKQHPLDLSTKLPQSSTTSQIDTWKPVLQNMSTQGITLVETTKPKPDTMSQPTTPKIAPPPGWSGGLLVPESKGMSKGKQTAQATNWSDFDPLI